MKLKLFFHIKTTERISHFFYLHTRTNKQKI